MQVKVRLWGFVIGGRFRGENRLFEKVVLVKRAYMPKCSSLAFGSQFNIGSQIKMQIKIICGKRKNRALTSYSIKVQFIIEQLILHY